MKNQVIKFFQELPAKQVVQFNKALELYRKSEHASLSMVRQLNVSGYSPTLLESLLYELKKLHGVTDAMIRNAKVMETIANDPFKLMVLPKFAQGNKGMKQRRDFIKKHELKVSGRKKIDLQNAIENYVANVNDDILAEKEQFEADINTLKELGKELSNPTPEKVAEMMAEFIKNAEDLKDDKIEVTAKTAEEVFPSAPDEVKAAVKLRDLYPFLSEEDCPDELKILVADKQTAYDKYVEAHNALLVIVPDNDEEKIKKMTEAEVLFLAKAAVKNFELNQDIIAELEYYKEKGEVLGEHPIFIKRKLQDGIMKMSMADAAKRQSNLENYIRRDTKQLEQATTDKDKVKFENKIKKWNAELDLINAKLGAK